MMAASRTTIGRFLLVVSFLPASALAQEPSSQEPAFRYVPITHRERTLWVVDGVVGPRSLAIGVVAASWQTARAFPEEWDRSWAGFGQRYLNREVDVALSNTLEAGVGALWGEDPRYIRSHRQGVWARTRYAMETVVLAPRPDGHIAPAWGRYVGNSVNGLLETAWLPSSATTPGQIAIGTADGFLSRLIWNLYEEFWPDAQRRLRRAR
jgi:hypothetical protein